MNRVIILVGPASVEPVVRIPCVIEHITFADGNKRAAPINLCNINGAEGDSDGGGSCTTFGGCTLDIDYVSDGN